MQVHKDGSFILQELMRTCGLGYPGLTAQIVNEVVAENMFHKDPSRKGTVRLEVGQDGNDVCIRVLLRRGGSQHRKVHRAGVPPAGSVRATAP